jgi:hypothetical protein
MYHCTTGYANFDITPTLTAQPLIGTDRMETTIKDFPADWSSTFDTLLPQDTNIVNGDHDTTGLCITIG